MAEPRSPLATRAADLAALDVVELPFLAQVSVRCGEEIAEQLGFPVQPNTVAGDMTRGMLWLGPDEWLVVGVPGSSDGLIAEYEVELAGVHHAIVDVSENRAVLELHGEGRFHLLASGCSLDLDARGGWVPRTCAQTLFGRAPVILQELGTATRIFVRPSFAGYVVDRLLATHASLVNRPGA